MEKELKIPLAFDVKEKIVFPWEVTKDNGPFKCLDCKQPVILRSGIKVRKHFAHAPQTQNKNSGSETRCNGETIQHKYAKILVAKYLPNIEIKQNCCSCDSFVFNTTKFHHVNGKNCVEKTNTNVSTNPDTTNVKLDAKTKEQSLTFTATEMERRVEPFIVDVAIYNENKMVGVIEIKYSHGMDKKKKDSLLEKFPNAVFELDAMEVIRALEEIDNLKDKDLKDRKEVLDIRASIRDISYSGICEKCSGPDIFSLNKYCKDWASLISTIIHKRLVPWCKEYLPFKYYKSMCQYPIGPFRYINVSWDTIPADVKNEFLHKALCRLEFFNMDTRNFPLVDFCFHKGAKVETLSNNETLLMKLVISSKFESQKRILLSHLLVHYINQIDPKSILPVVLLGTKKLSEMSEMY